MKKINFKNAILRMSGIMALAIGVAAFTACSDSDDNGGPLTGEYPEFKDMAAQTEATPAGSTVTLRFFAPGVWNLESKTNWLTVPSDKATGEAGDQTVTISVTDANRGFEDQEGTLAYRVNGQDYTYTIKRKAAELSITVGENNRIVVAEKDGSFYASNVPVTANYNWIAVYPDWIRPNNLDERGFWRGSADVASSNTLYVDASDIDTEGRDGVITFYLANGNEIDEDKYIEIPVTTNEVEDDYFYYEVEYGLLTFNKDGFYVNVEGNTTEQKSISAHVISAKSGYKIMAIEGYDPYNSGNIFFREADWVKITPVEQPDNARSPINSDHYLISIDANSGDNRTADLFFFPVPPKDLDEDLYDYENDYELFPEYEPYFYSQIIQPGAKGGIAFMATSFVTGTITNMVESGEVDFNEYGTSEVYKIIYPSDNDQSLAMNIYLPDVPFITEGENGMTGYLMGVPIDYEFEPESKLDIKKVLSQTNMTPYCSINIAFNTNNTGFTRKLWAKIVEGDTDELYAVIYVEQASN